MIKECPVIINNDYCTVVKYDDFYIQFPAVKKNVNTLKVEYKKGWYYIVEENEDTGKETIDNADETAEG